MTKRKICVLIAVLSVLALGGQALAHPGGLNTPSPDIPPIIVPGVYLSPGDVHAKYSAGALAIVLRTSSTSRSRPWIRHSLNATVPRVGAGAMNAITLTRICRPM